MADASPKFHPPDLLQPSTSTSSASASAAAAASHDGLEFCEFMIAGSIAGVVEHTAMFPVDTLKTRIQAAKTCKNYPNLYSVFRSILKSEGFFGLYRGIGAMGLGAGPAHAIYFSVYEMSKEFLVKINPNPNRGWYDSLAHASSGVLATVASDAMFTPMDTVKQRLQLKSSPYKGVGDCVFRVLREEGTRAFYASYRTTIVMNAPFTAVHFATYEAVKRGLMGVMKESERINEDGLVVHATAGAAAGALAAVVTTPLDVVKTRMLSRLGCSVRVFVVVKDFLAHR